MLNLMENERWNKQYCEFIEEAMKESSLVFVNTEEFLEFPRPISRKIVFIGGIAVPEISQLPKVCDTGLYIKNNHAN